MRQYVGFCLNSIIDMERLLFGEEGGILRAVLSFLQTSQFEILSNNDEFRASLLHINLFVLLRSKYSVCIELELE